MTPTLPRGLERKTHSTARSLGRLAPSKAIRPKTKRASLRVSILFLALFLPFALVSFPSAAPIRSRKDALDAVRDLSWIQSWRETFPDLKADLRPGDKQSPPGSWVCTIRGPRVGPLLALRLNSADGEIILKVLDWEHVILLPRRAPAGAQRKEKFSRREYPRTMLRIVGSDPRLAGFWKAHPGAALRVSYAPDAERWVIEVRERGRYLGFVTVSGGAATEIVLPGFPDEKLARIEQPQVLWRYRHAARFRYLGSVLVLIAGMLLLLGDFRSWRSGRNGDVLLLCLLFSLPCWFGAESAGQGVIMMFMLVTLAVRLALALRKEPRPLTQTNLSGPMLRFLFAVVVAGNVMFYATHEISDDARSGTIGARYLAQAGKYPYGHPMSGSYVPGDRTVYGPALYLTYLPIEAVWPSTFLREGIRRPVGSAGWEGYHDRETLITPSPRIVLVLFRVAQLALILLVGRKAGNTDAGLALAAAVGLGVLAFSGATGHIVPTTLLLAGVLWAEHALVAGALLAAASATFFYPAFLLPAWLAYYRRNRTRLFRFLLGVLIVGGLLLGSVAFLTRAEGPVQGLSLFLRSTALLESSESYGLSKAGFWGHFPELRRTLQLPVFIAFAAACLMPLFERKMTLRRLVTWCALLALATQFWKTHTSGYYPWYFALAVLALFWPAPDRECSTPGCFQA